MHGALCPTLTDLRAAHGETGCIAFAIIWDTLNIIIDGVRARFGNGCLELRCRIYDR